MSILFYALALLICPSVLPTVSQNATGGHIHRTFLFQVYENGTPNGNYVQLDVTIGRDGNDRPYGWCSYIKIGKPLGQTVPNAITLISADVTVSKLKMSKEIDWGSHLKSASFSVVFDTQDEVFITLQGMDEDGIRFDAHGRSTVKSFSQPPRLIDMEWRQVPTIEFPKGVSIIPL